MIGWGGRLMKKDVFNRRPLKLMDQVTSLGAWLFPFLVLLWRQVNDVHVDRLRLLQLRGDRAEAVSNLVAGHGDVLALDAEGERSRGEWDLIILGLAILSN